MLNRRHIFKKVMTIYATREDYYLDHEVCPKCGDAACSQTYEGFLFLKGRPYKDTNTCECSCGWVGIVDELIRRKNSLDESQKIMVANLIKKYQEKFRLENPMEHCGGGTVGDYYRINLEHMVIDLLDIIKLESTKKL